MTDNFRSDLSVNGKTYIYFDLVKYCQETGKSIDRLPFSLRILLEGCLRNSGANGFTDDQARTVVNWTAKTSKPRPAVPFLPSRILMQDFTGVPVLNDLTALRAAVKRDGKNPHLVNPRIPSNLVTDHSLQVIANGCPEARQINEKLEFHQNFERYQFLKWSQSAYDNLQILPPGLGICHQVNLEHLSQVTFTKNINERETIIYPDSVLGTDSHTTMINGLGIAGWGVGGVEALAAMLEYPSEFPLPDVVGVELTGSLPDTATPTDLTLNLTASLRKFGVVGKFVEVFGSSASQLPVETRAMIANMSPESGATMTYFPVDEQTIKYLIRTGRTPEHADLVEHYFKAQNMFRSNNDKHVEYSQIITFDLSQVELTLAGPKRPQDVFAFSSARDVFPTILTDEKGFKGFGLSKEDLSAQVNIDLNGKKITLSHGSVLIAAITSCTNTSDPSVMITAALLADKAAEKGLHCKSWVKTSFAPGSRVVDTYLRNAGLAGGLNKLGFHIVGYGCTTCIGNSGPIHLSLSKAVRENNLIAASVLSGNRNFEGRIHPDIQANYLASPPLVVAYAIAGNMNFNFETTPLGHGKDGNPVFLKDIYPSADEVKKVAEEHISSNLYQKNYSDIYENNPRWNEMEIPEGILFNYDDASLLIKEPKFLFNGFNGSGLDDIENARALAVLGDSITTDHISPAGRIAEDNPAAKYLTARGVQLKDFISFGARRGNHDVMARGTLSNPRLRNKLTEGIDGGFTLHIPSGEIMSIYNAAQRYMQDNIPLVILAGKAYGSGSSRDWAAKGTFLLGVQAVIAESFERIHRTNLICMGILPLQLKAGESAATLKIKGKELFSINEISAINSLDPELTVKVISDDGSTTDFAVTARIDTPLELAYFKSGGLMRKLRGDF